MNPQSQQNLKQAVKKSILLATSKVPVSILRTITKFANLSLGKGFGATTLKVEVSTVANFTREMNVEVENVFDVGANIGLYSGELRNQFPNAKITAFEPSQFAAKEYRGRFQEDSNVHLIQVAVGNVEGKATLYYDFEASGMASMSNRKLDHFGIEFKKSEEINVITLDSFSRDQGLIPDFLKIDVEGHELEVLNGAKEILNKIKLIQFEFGGCNIDTRTFFQDFYYLFKEAQFELFRITPNGLLRISRYSEDDEHFGTTNYLAANSRFCSLT